MSAFGNLSAPMEVHRQQAQRSLAEFQENLSDFEASLSRRDCSGAVNALVSMAVCVGEIDEGDSNEDLSIDVNLTLVDVHEQFKAACIRSTPSSKTQMLHGLKRRRHR